MGKIIAITILVTSIIMIKDAHAQHNPSYAYQRGYDTTYGQPYNPYNTYNAPQVYVPPANTLNFNYNHNSSNMDAANSFMNGYNAGRK